MAANSTKETSIQGKRNYNLADLEMTTTVGTGTFGRVILTKERSSKADFMALKIMEISEIIRLKQVEHVQNEKDILLSINHPFVVNLLWTHHDRSFLYMLLEYACGGELFTYLRTAGRFKNPAALFFAAEIISVFEYLHAKSIIYRDLKPENILLDAEGHVRLTDFGFAKVVKDKTWTLCGTPEYLAPELIQSKGHDKAVDWWALGILIFEMLCGYPPYFDDSPFGIYEKILAGRRDWPRHLEGTTARDIIKRLLANDRTRRLGNMKNGTEDVKNHKWLKGIDWNIVINRNMKPPIVPKLDHPGDTQNFDEYPEEDWRGRAKKLSSKVLAPFEDF